MRLQLRVNGKCLHEQEFFHLLLHINHQPYSISALGSNIYLLIMSASNMQLPLDPLTHIHASAQLRFSTNLVPALRSPTITRPSREVCESLILSTGNHLSKRNYRDGKLAGYKMLLLQANYIPSSHNEPCIGMYPYQCGTGSVFSGSLLGPGFWTGRNTYSNAHGLSLFQVRKQFVFLFDGPLLFKRGL